MCMQRVQVIRQRRNTPAMPTATRRKRLPTAVSARATRLRLWRTWRGSCCCASTMVGAGVGGRGPARRNAAGRSAADTFGVLPAAPAVELLLDVLLDGAELAAAAAAACRARRSSARDTMSRHWAYNRYTPEHTRECN